MNSLQQKCIDNEIEFTPLPDHAIYILPDGSLIDGCFYDGDRTEEHRITELLSEFDRYDGDKFWLDLFENLNMAMLVPESKQILITPKQKITPKQREVMNNLTNDFYYTIEVFK